MKKSPLFALVLLLGVLLLAALTVRNAPAGAFRTADYAIQVVRAYYTDPAQLNTLAAWKEPWEVNQKEGYAILDLPQSELPRLAAMGFRVEVDLPLTAEYNRPRALLPGQLDGIPGYPCYRTVEETFASAAQLTSTYPTLAQWTDIGDSWDKTTPGGPAGYDMMVLRLTNQNIPGPKPELYLFGSIHAREYAAAEVATRFAEYLLANYGTDPDATWLLDHHQIDIVLQANPDGRKIAETGSSWRKNTNNTDGCVTSYGVDLNRNFSFYWNTGGSSANACDETYHGSAAASEPETQALQSYAQTIFIDQRDPDINAAAPITTTGIFIDLHSYAQEILWPWGFTSNPPPNGAGMQTLARKMGYFSGYDATQSLYATSGTTKDFMYGEFGVPAYTIEMGTAFFQSCTSFESTVWPDLLPMLLYAAKATRYAYITPAGPDSHNLLLDNAAVPAGTPVTLTGIVDDTRYNNSQGTEPTQNIVAAEYYVDSADWNGGTPIPLAPADGSFNSPTEGVTTLINTTGFSAGQHMLFVRGQDAAGNWGAYSALYLYIIDPNAAPTLEGYVRDAVTNAPLAATVTIGDQFQTTTNPVTGFYQTQVISGTYDITATAADHAAQTINGVTLTDFQTTQQDFDLEPVCTAFYDDVESGNAGWVAQSPWGIVTEAAHSPTHAWTDSPGGSYANNRNVSLTSPILNLSNYDEVYLNYWQICDTEAGYDFCRVEVSTNGSTWTEVATYDGASSQWEEITLALPSLNNQPQAQIRFRFTSDISATADGWHIDDIRLYGPGAACGQGVAPTASFTSNSPVTLGEPVDFTNLSTGTDLSFAWDFGDGSPGSMATDPSHTYASAGTYTVILTATNSLGSDSFSDQVTVEEPGIAPTAFFSASATWLKAGETVDFTNGSTGTDLTYTWDFGDGSPVSSETNPSHLFAAPGRYTVTLTASNSLGSDTYSVDIVVYSGTLYIPILIKP